MDSPRILTKRGLDVREDGRPMDGRRVKEEEEVHSSFGVARSLSITFYLPLPLAPPPGCFRSPSGGDGETLPID